MPVASLQIACQASQPRDPFVLREGDDHGSSPVRLYPQVVNSWTKKPGAYDAILPHTLRMKALGVCRIRLYCPVRTAVETRLRVYGGQYRYLGRRREPLVETLTWTREHAQALRFFYDRPEVTTLEQTPFFDNDGNETSAPVYLSSQGMFQHPKAVTGAMVVSYRPSFALYEIQYDTGESQISRQAFREMKLAWLAGNIRDAAIPPVRVVAIGKTAATQLVFQRKFWPEYATVRQWFQEEVREPEMTPVTGGFRINADADMDPCWYRCKEKVKPGETYLTRQDRRAILDCVAQSQQPQYHYVESRRTVKTERISSPVDPAIYVDVERPVELAFRIQRVDDTPCEDETSAPCCQEMVLRFGNPHP